MALVDKYLPEWARCTLAGMIPVYSVLPTKDGRRCGNAIVFHIGELHGQKTWWIITDSGTIMRLTHGEMGELFHQPLYQAYRPQSHLLRAIEEEMAIVNQTAASKYSGSPQPVPSQDQ